MDTRKPEQPLALNATGIRKVFGGEVALANADFSVRVGEIHGLLGANGAGKSTLVRIICGVEHQDGGTVAVDGRDLPVPHTAADVRALGLAHIDQDRALVADMSIAENMALTMGYPQRRRLVDWRAVRRQARTALERVGLTHDVDAFARELPIADQTLVAIARALAVDARIILLDEPTANLGAKDAQLLYERLRQLASEGVAAVLITHALVEALDVCHRLTVLRDGQAVATRASSELTEEQLTTLVVGHQVGASAFHTDSRKPASESVRLRLDRVQVERLGPLTLDLHAGEIVGVTGLADSGHLLVGELLSGMLPLDAGTMNLDGAEYRPASPAEARERRVGYLPPDRVRDGLATQMSCRENLFFDGRAVTGSTGIPRGREIQLAGEHMRAARVRPPHPEAIVSTLSGGNMQKVLMAKWLARDPQVLVLCEPTVGVDVGAREDIYERLHEACERGLAIILASSDFEEVAALCDRVLVVQYGEVVAEVNGAEARVDRLTALAGGGEGGLRAA
jgi:ribose transport system ATP-binding protein